MPKTQRECLVFALEKRGYTIVVPAPSTKYVKMSKLRDDGFLSEYWVGKAGALRFGSTAGGSVSASEKFRQTLLQEGADA